MSAAAQQPNAKAGSPNDFLKGVIGKNVNVRLNSGIDYRGVLSCLDGYMNIALEQTVEYVDGIKKNSYGDAFIRGNNGKFVDSFQFAQRRVLTSFFFMVRLTCCDFFVGFGQ